MSDLVDKAVKAAQQEALKNIHIPELIRSKINMSKLDNAYAIILGRTNQAYNRVLAKNELEQLEAELERSKIDFDIEYEAHKSNKESLKQAQAENKELEKGKLGLLAANVALKEENEKLRKFVKRTFESDYYPSPSGWAEMYNQAQELLKEKE